MPEGREAEGLLRVLRAVLCWFAPPVEGQGERSTISRRQFRG